MPSLERSLQPSRISRSDDLRRSRNQARTIARATFDGFLQSDLMPAGMQAPALIWGAAFVVAPALCFPAQAMVKYPYIRRFFPDRLEATFWGDRMLLGIMSAGAIGLVSVVLWETLFPARRDAFVLTPLPVSLPVQMFGRLLGLMMLCTAFVVALNTVPAVTFPLVASASFASMPRPAVGHFVSTSAADLFVFFSITSLQGLVILGFGRRAAGKLAAAAQTATVLIVLVSLIFMPLLMKLTHDGIMGNDPGNPRLLFNPIAWFLGLDEFITGTKRAIMGTLALRAVLATTIVTAATVAIYALGYEKLLKRAVETPPRSTRSIFAALGSRIVRWTFIRRPEEQAICAFVVRAVARSGRHSLLLSIYFGTALALMVTFVLPDLLRQGLSSLSSPTISVLALPLVLSVGLAVGLRILISIPAEMPARWIFQTSAIGPRSVDAATHKALLLLVIPPVAAAAAFIAGMLWGPRLGAIHAAYCASLALLLCEVLLIGYRGVPMTRPYVPGGSRFHMLWAVYLSVFLTYTLTSARLERDLLKISGSRGVLNAAAVFCGLALAVWIYRKLRLRTVEDVTFEAKVGEDETFKGFNLTEIYAAQSVAAKGRAAQANEPAKRPV